MFKNNRFNKICDIGDIRRNENEIIRVEVDKSGNIYLVNIRVHKKEGDEWKPTEKGISMSVDKAQQLDKYLQEAISNIVDALLDARG